MSKERQSSHDALNTALLDEIAQRLLNIEVHNKELSPEGIVEPLAVIIVTTANTIVEPPNLGNLWFSVSIINDGPDPCWVVINSGKSSTTPHRINDDETYEVSFIKPVIQDLMLSTDSGTASVRITGTR